MQVCFNTTHRINPPVTRAKSWISLSLLPTGHLSHQSQVPECDPLLRETCPWDCHHGKGRVLHTPDCGAQNVPRGLLSRDKTPLLTTIHAIHLVCSDTRQRAPKDLTVDRKLLEGGKCDRAVAVSLAAELNVGDQLFQVCHVLALGQHVRLQGEGF